MQRRKFIGLAAAALLGTFAPAILPSQTWGQTSQAYALLGKKLWVAFSCAAVADVTDDKAEETRLFKIAYESGKTFIDAVQSGKVEANDINNEVPMSVLFVLKGPSADFILGRIWESAIDEATKDVFALTDKALQKVMARRKYSEMNCSLIR